MVSKQISIQVLKSGLSSIVAEAEAGGTIIITRHNAPVAQLGPARTEHVRRGSAVGTARLRPALVKGSKGRYLAILRDDRDGR